MQEAKSSGHVLGMIKLTAPPWLAVRARLARWATAHPPLQAEAWPQPQPWRRAWPQPGLRVLSAYVRRRASTSAAIVTGRIQTVCARSSASFSDGVMNPRVLRGLPLRLRAIRAMSSAECTDRSVPLGRYWRSSPLTLLCQAASSCRMIWCCQVAWSVVIAR
jgi:hypothetical protein